MNVFTLTAAGLVALGVPLAAPWLAQESAPTANTALLAPAQVIDLRGAFASTTAEPAPLAVISTSPFAPASTQDAPAPARVRALAPDALFPASTGALLAPQDDAARQIAELQARIAALQAEVAALAQQRNRAEGLGGPAVAEVAAAHDAQRRGLFAAALADEAKAQADALYAAEHVAHALEAQHAAREHQRAAAQDQRDARGRTEGNRRLAEHEAERAHFAGAHAEALRMAEAELELRHHALEEQHALHADALATLETSIAEHEAAMAAIEVEFESAELTPRRQERLEGRYEELQEQVEVLNEAIAEHHEDLEEAMAEFEELQWSNEEAMAEYQELQWSDEEEIARAYGQFEASEDFYVETEEVEWLADTEACEECEEDVFEEPASTSYLETAVVEEWLRQAYDAAGGEAASDWRGDGQGTALPRPSNGDVIVNVGGGGGGNDAQIVDLLREIRDEVRGLREDLRNLHGAPMPAAPRGSRGSRADFGYAPNSSSGPGVATGGGYDQGADPFGRPQTIAPQADDFPTNGNPYGDAPSAPSVGDPNALSSVEIHAPRVIRQPSPLIDAALRAAGPATVHVNLLVSEAGAVANAAVKSSTDSRFEQAALDAVTQWVFEPGTVDGEPSAMFVDVPIVFPSTGK